jgi:sugar phosphate isomerase/epimerase
MARLRIALSILGLRGRPKSVLDWIAEMGFHEVELPVEGEPFGLAELDQSGLRDLRHQLATRLLVPISIYAPISGAWNRSSEAEAALERVDELLLRYALPLRLPLVLEVQPLSEGEDASEEVLQEALARLRQTVEHVELSVFLTGPLLTLERMRRFVAETDSPFLGVALDPKSLLEVEADWRFWLSEWAGQIGHAYASDGKSVGGSLEPCRLGEGELPWQDLVEQLQEQEYAGAVVIRADRLPDPYGDALHAKAFLERF